MARPKMAWKSVRFADMVTSAGATRKARGWTTGDEGVERYVGLEHLDANSPKIRRWGSPETVGENSDLRHFEAGDVILARRGIEQRKVGMADFRGVASGHALVFRARPEVVLPEFLPYFLLSDAFMNRALDFSAGSLSKTVNLSALMKQEFALPPLEEQREAAAMLGRCEEVLSARREVLDKSTVLYRSVIDAGFAGRLTDSGSTTAVDRVGEVPTRWRICTLEEVTTKIVDGVHKRPNYVESGIPFLTIENLTKGPGIDFSDTRFVSERDHHEFSRRAPVESGDVIVSKDGTLGVARVVETSRAFSIFVSLAVLKPLKATLNPWFLRYYFDSTMFLRRLAGKASGSALKHIHLVDFRAARIPVPEYSEQDKIVSAVKDVDNAHTRALSGVSEARTLKRALLARVAQGYA